MSLDPSPTPTAEIENLLAERRTFPPDPAFAAQANATADLYAEAEADPEAFWARLARERIDWDEPFHTTLEWDLPFAKWFVGGKLNIAYNCVDRHVERTGSATRSPTTGSASPATPGRSPTRTSSARSEGRQRAARARHRRPATGSRSTCR